MEPSSPLILHGNSFPVLAMADFAIQLLVSEIRFSQHQFPPR